MSEVALYPTKVAKLLEQEYAHVSTFLYMPTVITWSDNDFTEYQFLALISDTRDVLNHKPLIMCNIDALNPNSTG